MGQLGTGELDRSLGAKWRRLVTASRSDVAPETLVFPTDAQTDLLKAALFPDERAATAWRRWKSRGLELQTITDVHSTQLFPLLWVNHEAARIGAEDLPILKGVYRRTIVLNATKLANARTASQLLERTGIPVLFIKGAAMIALTGGRFGLRRIADADILVREADAERAISVLVAAGYQPVADTRPTGFSHGRAYRKPTGEEVDLHWYAYKTAGDDSAAFDSAQECDVLGSRVAIPSATECLIVAIAHAFQESRGPGAAVRWIADSMVLLGNAQIDWDYLLERSKRPGLTPGLRDGLRFLTREFGAPVPGFVIRELERRPIGVREHLAHWAVVHRPVVGCFLSEHLNRHHARRLHPWAGLPNDFLWHLAQAGGGVRRRDVLRRAPRTAVRTTALLAVRSGARLGDRWNGGR